MGQNLIYKVKDEDTGEIYKFEGPAGIPESEVLAAVESQKKLKKTDFSGVKSGSSTTAGAKPPSMMDNLKSAFSIENFKKFRESGAASGQYGSPSDLDSLLNTRVPEALAETSKQTREAAGLFSGAAAGVGTGSPLAASATGAYINSVLKKATGEPYTGSVTGHEYDSHIGNAIEDTIANEALGKLFDLGGYGIKQILGKGTSQIAPQLARLRPTVGQGSGSKLLSTFEDIFAGGAKKKAIEDSLLASGQAIKQEAESLAGRKLLNIEDLRDEIHAGVQWNNMPVEDVDTVLKDHALTKRYLAAGGSPGTNPRRDLQAYSIMKLWDDSFKPTSVLDPTIGKLSKEKFIIDSAELLNSKVGKELFGSPTGQTSKNFAELFDAIGNIASGGQSYSNFLKFDIGRKLVYLSPALLLGKFSTALSSLGVIGAAGGAHILARSMTNKKIAPIVLKMIKGEPLGMSTKLAGRMLMQALNGERLRLQTKNGDIDATIVDGEVVPQQ